MSRIRREADPATGAAQTLAMSLMVLVVVLGGCGSISAAGGGTGAGRSSASPVQGGWVLISGTGPKGSLHLVPAHDVTLTVTDDRVSGKAACNSYSGRVSLTAGGGFAVSDGLSITEMACADQRANDLESAYVRALGTVTSADVTGDRLVLRGGGTELIFTRPAPVPDAPVEGTTWSLDTIVHGPIAGSTRQNRPTPTLRLDAGKLTASTGCRRLAGGYTLTGSRLTVTVLTRGKAACAGTDPFDQDTLIVKALTAGADITVEGNQLTLTAGPELELRYRAQADA